jgi:hypothetical protein
MTMEYTPVAPDVYHDSTLQHLQDTGRFTPTHRVHPPPVAASPLVDPPLEPYESCASIEIDSPAHSATLSSHLHLTCSSPRPLC